MNYLPEGSVLGKLETLEVYEFYDTPVLFVAQNSAGNLYLVVMEDDGDEAIIWLYVAMSQSRYEHVRSGAIDLYSAFALAEDGLILEVSISRNTDDVSIAPLRASDVPPERLPIEGESLNLATPTLPAAVRDLGPRATQTLREILQLELIFPDQTRTEAPAKPLGEILSALQDTITALAEPRRLQYKDKRRRARSLARDTEVDVTSLSAASFNVELASANTVNMFGDSLVGDAVEALLLLLSAGNESDVLKERLNQYTTTVSSKYLDLLNSLNRSTVDIARLTWNSPRANRGGTAEISSPVILGAIEILQTWEEVDTRIFRVIGTLIGINIRTKVFEIDTREERYKGDFSPDISVEAFNFISNSTISQRYGAQIRRTTRTKLATGEQQITHNLIELTPPIGGLG